MWAAPRAVLQSFSMTKSRLSESLLIDRVADTISHRERHTLDRAIVRMVVEFLDARSVVLYQLLGEVPHKRMVQRAGYAGGNLQPRVRVTHDLSGLPKLADRQEWCTCVGTQRPVQYSLADGNSAICFPIEEGAGVTGILEIELTDTMSEREVRMVGGILRILRNQIALLDYGERDTLTGLFNRKTFESRFEKICADLQEGVSLASEPRSWLGLLDIDHFKSINDTYGHVIGDEVLLLVSQIMQRTLRGGDQLFRFGGEEFVVILEETNAAGALIAFERIRAAIEGHVFPQVVQLTASVGYTAIQRQDAPTTCIERADAALYFIKRNGRNGVGSFERLVTSGELVLKDNSGDVQLF
jgi:diguanylate cyclase (GGDEF)-like protein